MKRRLSYKEVTNLIDKQFSWLKTKYPLSYYYLETEIRLSLAGDHFALEQNLKKYSKISILKILLLTVWKIALTSIKLPYCYADKKTAYLNISRHLQLQKRLNKGFRQKGIEVLSHPLKYLKMFNTRNYVPLGPIVSSSFDLRSLHRHIAMIGLYDFLASEKELKKLEKVLHKRVRVMSRFMKLLRIKYLILQNEHSPHEKILTLAAAEIKAKIIVIAHGYFQKSGSLVTVAPIRAEELIVWTPSQREMLLKETGYNEKKISYYGWPFEVSEPICKLPNFSPLFILSDIDNDFDEKEFELTVEVLKKFAAAHSKFRIRPHPSFYRSATQRKKLIQTKFDQYIKIETLTEQLRQSYLVTGHDSSVLLQAYFENIPTYRIEEISILDIPEVPIISLDKILSMASPSAQANATIAPEINAGIEKVANAIISKMLAF
ncbi:hypothetical protein N9T57_02780 [Paracoccaceae bacterium]|nr:hypothetical protein [Paracoccaceae bacterium]